VYVLGHNGKVAIAESLAIVGGIALAGMLPYARARQVDWRSVVFFGLPGMAGTYGGAWLAKFISGPAQLVIFGGVMLAAAGMMFRKRPAVVGRTSKSARLEETGQRSGGLGSPPYAAALEGFVVGVMTGVVGVGGGFLIVPALVILGRLPMRLAVGTSLAVISLNSGIGFLKYLGALRDLHLAVDWHTIAVFLAVGVAGSLAGNALGARMNQQVLRKVFAMFLVAMGLFVVAREAPHVMRLALGSGVQSSVLPAEDAGLEHRPIPAIRNSERPTPARTTLENST
jgi:uncharacterized membrane protein YfcA